MRNKVERSLQDSIEKRIFTGASYAYKGKDSARIYNCMGTLGETDEKVTEDTLFDMASCTKIFTSLAFMRLLEEGRITLSDTIERYLPTWSSSNNGKITMFELLTHTSTLPAHIPLYQLSRDKEGAQEILKHLLPRVSKGVEYSCLGFIILGWVLEKVTNLTLDRVIEKYVCLPLEMKNTVYCPLEKNYSNIMPTGYCAWRNRMLIGEVNDENAYHLGGVSGNAGLFSNRKDMSRLAEAMLTGEGIDGTKFLHKETIACMTKCYTKRDREFRGLGWCVKNTPDMTAGDYFSDNSFGHTGFTGTSIWIDKDNDFYAILLTNRVFYSREVSNIRHARQVFHNLSMLDVFEQS